jgi:TfoX/Sxy family transcriptional regulator of competence genes
VLLEVVKTNHSGTVNIFRNMVGQTELFWQDQEHIQRQIQQAKQLKKEQQFSLSNTTNRLDKKTSE